VVFIHFIAIAMSQLSYPHLGFVRFQGDVVEVSFVLGCVLASLGNCLYNKKLYITYMVRTQQHVF